MANFDQCTDCGCNRAARFLGIFGRIRRPFKSQTADLAYASVSDACND